MPTSLVHDTVFMALSDWKGKVHLILYKVILFILLFAPILDGIMCLISLYCLYVYCQCLSIHNQNSSTIEDPFKNMVYDHDLCFKLRKDYYSFSIEFKGTLFPIFRTLGFQPQLQQRYAKIADPSIVARQGKLPNLQWQFLGQLPPLQ